MAFIIKRYFLVMSKLPVNYW